MTEHEIPEEKSKYLMGNDIYRGRIKAIEASVSNDMNDWEKLTAIEAIEDLELKIYQNERRHAVFELGATFSDINDIIDGKGGVTTYDRSRTTTSGFESDPKGTQANGE